MQVRNLHALPRLTGFRDEQGQARPSLGTATAQHWPVAAGTVCRMCGGVLQHKARMNVAPPSAKTGNKRRIAA